MSPPRVPQVDVEQIWWELDQRKRDVIERFARSFPAMVDPSQAKEMCITDFRVRCALHAALGLGWARPGLPPGLPHGALAGFCSCLGRATSSSGCCPC